MFWETILIWGGSSTAGYGVYLWGPTIVALLLGVPVPRAAAYFVFVSAAGVTGKIVVTLIAPLIGRRVLGVVWGFGGTVALALAGYYNSVFVGGVPLMVVLMCASTFCIEGGFSNLAPYTVESYGVSLGARSSGLGQTANGFGKIIGPLSLALIAGHQPARLTATDGGGGISGLPVPGLLHGAGRALVPVSRRRDARQGHGPRPRRGALSASAGTTRPLIARTSRRTTSRFKETTKSGGS